MLAEELVVVNAAAPSWQAVHPLLTVVTRLEHNNEYVWHGWDQKQIAAFLATLPKHCTLIAGVWSVPENTQAQEHLLLSCICEIMNGNVHTLRTFEALVGDSLPSVEVLEPGYEHALEIMRATRQSIAPVAWALFTDKHTWDEWIYTGSDVPIEKGQLLASFARQGRCVLMGNQVQRHET